MPTPPVKPMWPSTIRSLRWVRLFRREMPHQSGLWNLRIWTPERSISRRNSSSILALPTQSSSTWTWTPARARSDNASAKARPMSPDQ